MAEAGSIGVRLIFLIAEMAGEILVDFLKRTLGLPARLASTVAPAGVVGVFRNIDKLNTWSSLGGSCSGH